MTPATWKAIGQYGFATVAAVFLGVYYRLDVVLPQREQNMRLITVNELQAKNDEQQTAILKAMSEDIADIKTDQKKFPAVAEAKP